RCWRRSAAAGTGEALRHPVQGCPGPRRGYARPRSELDDPSTATVATRAADPLIGPEHRSDRIAVIHTSGGDLLRTPLRDAQPGRDPGACPSLGRETFIIHER